VNAIDIKKFGGFKRVRHRTIGDPSDRGTAAAVGWEFAHICVDDDSRITFTEIKPDERKQWCARQGAPLSGARNLCILGIGPAAIRHDGPSNGSPATAGP
jgi:hypothetical protein